MNINMAVLSFTLGLLLLKGCEGQGIAGGTMLDVIRGRPELSTYYNLIIGANAHGTFEGISVYTVFAPNNTAFEMMSRENYIKFMNQDAETKRNYFKFLAIWNSRYLQSQFRNQQIIDSAARDKNKLFISIKTDVPGRKQVYVNGALIDTPDIQAANGIIHIIDRVPRLSSRSSALGYIQDPDDPSYKLGMFRELLYLIPEDKYNTRAQMNNENRLTLFVPTDEAIKKISPGKLAMLKQNVDELNVVIRKHYAMSQVVYTHYARNAEQILLPENRKLLITKTPSDEVFVSSEEVSAKIIVGNITIANGVIHLVDTLFYVYNSVREEISTNALRFNQMISSTPDVEKIVDGASNRITAFVFNDTTYNNAAYIPGVDLVGNRTLSDFVIRSSFLQAGNTHQIMYNFGGYNSRIELASMYYNRLIKIYTQEDVIYVEGGYVRTRVTRANVGCTNGIVHYIDGILGVPKYDITDFVDHDKWLRNTYYALEATRLNYQLKKSRFPSNTGNNFNSNSNNFQTAPYCDWNNPCEFTFFVPNGTAIDNFLRTPTGLAISKDRDRYSWVLRRHIARGITIHLDQMALGTTRYRADNGEYVNFRKINDRGIVEVYFQNEVARVIHSDLGATNGIIHFVDNVLATRDDLIRDVSRSNQLTGSLLLLMCSIFLFSYCK